LIPDPKSDGALGKAPMNWFDAKVGRYGGREFYSRSPFRHRRFRWSFVTLILVNAYAVFLVVRFWSRLSGWAIFWLAVALVATMRLFWVVYSSHESLRRLITGGELGRPQTESASDMLLGILAGVSNWALALGLAAVVALLLALFGELIRH